MGFGLMYEETVKNFENNTEDEIVDFLKLFLILKRDYIVQRLE